MCRVRSSSLSGRVFSCFLIRSVSYSSSEKQAAMPRLHVRAHVQSIHVKGRRVFFDQRRARAQVAEVLGRTFVDGVRMRIGRRRQIDLRARHVQKAQRIAVGQRSRFVGVDDVVRDRSDSAGRFGHRTQCCERKNGGHETFDYMAAGDIEQLTAIGQLHDLN